MRFVAFVHAIVCQHVIVRRYIEGCKDSEKLLDLLSAIGSDEIEPTKTVAARQALYPEVCRAYFCRIYALTTLQYLPMATLLAGVKSGQLHQGHFNANQYNYLEVGFPNICDMEIRWGTNR